MFKAKLVKMGNGYWTVYNITTGEYRGAYETKTMAMRALRVLTA